MSLSTRLTATSDLQTTLYEILDATIELQGPDFSVASQLPMLPQSTPLRSRL